MGVGKGRRWSNQNIKNRQLLVERVFQIEIKSWILNCLYNIVTEAFGKLTRI